jgi:hypothetical protein
MPNNIAATLLEAIRDQSYARQSQPPIQRQTPADLYRERKEQESIRAAFEALKEADALLDATNRAGILADEIRADREANKRATAHINALNKTQVLDRVFEMADELRAQGGGRLGYRPGTGEEASAWWKRVDALMAKVRKLWRDNEGRIKAGEMRYVEGLPVREVVRCPRLEPHLRRDVLTGLGACEGCVVAGMRCSRVWGFEGEKKQGCVRCRRVGRECVDARGGDGERGMVVDVFGGEVGVVDVAGFALPLWWDEMADETGEDGKSEEEQKEEKEEAADK